jgi:hypothetical protein
VVEEKPQKIINNNMSKDSQLIAEAYSKVLESYIDPHQLMVNLVAAITAGSTMYGGATSPDADNITERTVLKVIHCVENGSLNSDALFNTFIRARRENGRAFASFVDAGERKFSDNKTFTKKILPVAKKILTATPEDLRELEGERNANKYLQNRVDHS